MNDDTAKMSVAREIAEEAVILLRRNDIKTAKDVERAVRQLENFVKTRITDMHVELDELRREVDLLRLRLEACEEL